MHHIDNFSSQTDLVSKQENFFQNFQLELKTLHNGRFSGYASVYNVEDSHHDIILSGAFQQSLQNKNYGQDIKLLWQHQAEEPIGYFTKIVEDEIGLYVEGKLLMEVARARGAYSLLKSGAINGLSIGFSVKNSSVDEDFGTRLIHEADLWEVSLVTFPANIHAQILDVKSDDYNQDFIHLNQAIDRAIEALRK